MGDEERIVQGDQGSVGDGAGLQLVRFIARADIHRLGHLAAVGELAAQLGGGGHVVVEGAGGVEDAGRNIEGRRRGSLVGYRSRDRRRMVAGVGYRDVRSPGFHDPGFRRPFRHGGVCCVGVRCITVSRAGGLDPDVLGVEGAIPHARRQGRVGRSGPLVPGRQRWRRHDRNGTDIDRLGLGEGLPAHGPDKRRYGAPLQQLTHDRTP